MNQVTLLGRLGGDAEFKETPSGTKICRFSLATSEGKEQKKTSWHKVILFNDTAERYAPQLKKGCEVFIQGKISYSEYTDKDGNKKTNCDIIGAWVRVCVGATKTLSNDRYAGQEAGITPPVASPKTPTVDYSYQDDIPF